MSGDIAVGVYPETRVKVALFGEDAVAMTYSLISSEYERLYGGKTENGLTKSSNSATTAQQSSENQSFNDKLADEIDGNENTLTESVSTNVRPEDIQTICRLRHIPVTSRPHSGTDYRGKNSKSKPKYGLKKKEPTCICKDKRCHPTKLQPPTGWNETEDKERKKYAIPQCKVHVLEPTPQPLVKRQVTKDTSRYRKEVSTHGEGQGKDHNYERSLLPQKQDARGAKYGNISQKSPKSPESVKSREIPEARKTPKRKECLACKMRISNSLEGKESDGSGGKSDVTCSCAKESSSNTYAKTDPPCTCTDKYPYCTCGGKNVPFPSTKKEETCSCLQKAQQFVSKERPCDCNCSKTEPKRIRLIPKKDWLYPKKETPCICKGESLCPCGQSESLTNSAKPEMPCPICAEQKIPTPIGKMDSPCPCATAEADCPCARKEAARRETTCPCAKKERSYTCTKKEAPCPCAQKEAPCPCVKNQDLFPHPKKDTPCPCVKKEAPCPCVEKESPSSKKNSSYAYVKTSMTCPCIKNKTLCPCTKKARYSRPYRVVPCPRIRKEPSCPCKSKHVCSPRKEPICPCKKQEAPCPCAQSK